MARNSNSATASITVDAAREIVAAHDQAQREMRIAAFKAKAAELAGNDNVQKGAIATAGLGLGYLLANALS